MNGDETALRAAIEAIECYFPARRVSNQELLQQRTDWDAEDVEAKTGIESRHIAAEDEYASDLAVAAGEKLLKRVDCRGKDVGFLLLCTQSPDYLLPTTACLVQDRLDLSTEIGAFDINLGCSGFVYGLSVAKGLIESGQANAVLLMSCETYSKLMDPENLAVRALFGDAATATLVVGRRDAPEGGGEWIGPFDFGTDGRGAPTLTLNLGGVRHLELAGAPPAQGDILGAPRDPSGLQMNGPEVLTFTLQRVPESVSALLKRAQVSIDAVDHFVFHQANKYILEHLRRKLGIPAAKFVYALRDCGNTTSSSIPIALKRASAQGRIRPGDLVMLVGFGVGYSWGSTLIRWLRG